MKDKFAEGPRTYMGIQSAGFPNLFTINQVLFGNFTRGAEWIVEFGNEAKGIGTGSNEIAPLVGLAFVKGNTVLIPLVQHFVSYDGPDVSTTAVRLIAIQSLPNDSWGKLDVIVPIEWQNQNAVPATAEVQLGKLLSPSFGVGGLEKCLGVARRKLSALDVGLVFGGQLQQPQRIGHRRTIQTDPLPDLLLSRTGL